jgi:hypothetical protein
MLLFSNVAQVKKKRGVTMGYGLEKYINRGKKLVIQVPEGKKRPEVPVQAAKLASECGIALRDGLPIYKSWKDYDNEAAKKEVGKVLSAVAVSYLFHCSLTYFIVPKITMQCNTTKWNFMYLIMFHLCVFSQGWRWM